MGEIDYIQNIREEPGNQIRHRILTDRGQVVDFVVQYETRIDGEYLPVVRYDGSHGRGHRDILNMRGETITKWWLPDHMDMNACHVYALRDVRTNWRQYRDRFLEQSK